MKNALIPWFVSAPGDSFLYDSTYGGLVSKDGINNQQSDFGIGWYNDHHFHYGYFIYACAVLIQFDATPTATPTPTPVATVTAAAAAVTASENRVLTK